MKKNRVIKPQFFYDKDGIQTAVYLTVRDYECFVGRIKKMSDEISVQQANSKKKKKTGK